MLTAQDALEVWLQSADSPRRLILIIPSRWSGIIVHYNAAFLPLRLDSSFEAFNIAAKFAKQLKTIATRNLINVLFLFDVHSDKDNLMSLSDSETPWKFKNKSADKFFRETLRYIKRVQQLVWPTECAAVYFSCNAVEGNMKHLVDQYEIPFAFTNSVANIEDTRRFTLDLLIHLALHKNKLWSTIGNSLMLLFGMHTINDLLAMKWYAPEMTFQAYQQIPPPKPLTPPISPSASPSPSPIWSHSPNPTSPNLAPLHAVVQSSTNENNNHNNTNYTQTASNEQETESTSASKLVFVLLLKYFREN